MVLSFIPTAAWFLSGVTVLLVFVYKRKSSSSTSTVSSVSRLPLPPGPRGLKALKSIIRGVISGSFHEETTTWGETGAPITCCAGKPGVFVSLNTPELVRELLAGRNTESAVNDRPFTFIGRYLFYGTKDVAMACMSPVWGAQRKMFHTSLRLYGDGISQFESTVQGELTHLIEQLNEKDGQDICMEDYISRTLLNILSILLTGERPSADSELPEVMRHLDRSVSKMGTPAVDITMQLFPFLRFLPGWFKSQCKQVIDDRNKLLDSVFAHSKATAVKGEPRGIVDVMLLAQNSGAFSVSDDHIKGLILDIVVGGYVTSLTSFLSTVLVVLNHPHIARAIQEELDNTVGQRLPTLDDRKDCHYTEATLLEMLRYMRFFPLGLPHFCTEDTQIAGYQIPKNAMIFANQWLCGRDPNAWEQPDKFMPERFLDDNGQLLSADHPRRKNLLPFGIGKRVCPGETFARTRLFLLVTTLLQRFDFLPPKTGEVIPLDNIDWTPGAVLLLPTFQCSIRRRAA